MAWKNVKKTKFQLAEQELSNKVEFYTINLLKSCHQNSLQDLIIQDFNQIKIIYQVLTERFLKTNKKKIIHLDGNGDRQLSN